MFPEHFDPRQDGRSNFQVAFHRVSVLTLSRFLLVWRSDVEASISINAGEKRPGIVRVKGLVFVKSGCLILDTRKRGTSRERQDFQPDSQRTRLCAAGFTSS